MAGDWIKMRSNLWDDPRVSRLCDITGASEAAIVGALYWLWATADQHSEDGVLPGLSPAAIDRKTGVKGIADGLITIGWMADHPEGVRIVRFEEHNGKSAKRRCSEAVRKMSARDADKMQQECAPREREEIEVNTPLPPQGGKRDRAKAVTFKTFLEACKAKGEKPIADYKPALEYAGAIGLPHDFLVLCWNEFYRQHSAGGVNEQRKQADWRKKFRNCLEGNWYKLWWHNPATGHYELTTAGRTAEKVAA